MNFSNVPDTEYTAPNYNRTVLVENMHAVPRLGHTNQIQFANSNNDQIVNDYFYGVATLGAILLLIFVTWSVANFLLRCCGNRIGCTASSRSPYVMRRQGYYNNSSSSLSGRDYQTDLQSWKKRVVSARVVVAVSSLMSLAALVVLAGDALPSLDRAYDKTNYQLGQLVEMLDEGQIRVKGYLSAIREPIVNRDSILLMLSESSWCTSMDEDGIIIDINNGDILLNVTESLDDYTSNLVLLDNFLEEGVEKLGNNIVTITEEAAFAMETLDNYDWWYYAALGFSGVLAVFVVVFIVDLLKALCSGYGSPFGTVSSSCALPCFAFFVYTAWFLAAGFCMIAVLTADMCYSPDSNAVSIVSESFEEMDPLLNEQLIYYAEGCNQTPKPDSPTLFLQDLENALASTKASGSFFLSQVNSVSRENLSNACGNDVSNFLDNGVLEYQNSLSTLTKSASDLNEVFFCSNMNLIYRDIFYEAVCDVGMDGSAKTFASLITVAITSMIIITMVTCWYDDCHGDDEKEYDCVSNDGQGNTMPFPTNNENGNTGMHCNKPQNVPVSPPVCVDLEDDEITNDEPVNDAKGKSSIFSFFRKRQSNTKIDSANPPVTDVVVGGGEVDSTPIPPDINQNTNDDTYDLQSESPSEGKKAYFNFFGKSRGNAKIDEPTEPATTETIENDFSLNNTVEVDRSDENFNSISHHNNVSQDDDISNQSNNIRKKFASMFSRKEKGTPTGTGATKTTIQESNNDEMEVTLT